MSKTTEDKEILNTTENNEARLSTHSEKEFACLKLRLNSGSVVYNFDFARFTVEPMQLDILALLMQFIDEENDTPENRSYSFTVEDYMVIRGYDDYELAKKELTHKVCGDLKGKLNTGMIHNGFDISVDKDTFFSMNLFSKIAFKDDVLTFTLTDRAKLRLLNLKRSQIYKTLENQIQEFAYLTYKELDERLASVQSIAAKKGLSYISFKPADVVEPNTIELPKED